MAHRIEIALKRGSRDALGACVLSEIRRDLCLDAEKVRTIDVYTIDASLAAEDLTALAEALVDPVIQEWSLDSPLARGFDWLLEVGFRPGVTDNVGRTASETARLVLKERFPESGSVFTSRQYLINGELIRSEVERIAVELLCNPLINRHTIIDRDTFETQDDFVVEVPRVTDSAVPKVESIEIELDDDALLAMSRDKTWALSLEEMHAIRDFYRRSDILAKRAELGLPSIPTDVELEVLAQTWSEHCKHKIFSAKITYNAPGEPTLEIDSLFKSYIRRTTATVRQNLGRDDYCLSVFEDNAGVWKLDDDWSLVFKVETHNSPSALDPYGGALTGIVGVNRDPHGTGQGARLFCNTNVFCLASPFHEGEIPPRLLHPHRVMEGVRKGVEHGGNKSGIPTVNGSLVFDERFLGKPLVFCGTGGIMPAVINGKPSHEKAARAGDLVLMVGGRIGKDGIHGATFSSEELHEGSPATAVQIGDPITQKRMIDFLLRARDQGLYSCLTDNGAGGLSSSIGEMASVPGGARIDLARCPLKYQGLMPWEIFLSEAQERMTLAVPPENLDRFIALAEEMGVEATNMGVFTEGPDLEIFYDGKPAALLNMDFLHNGVPQMQLEARFTPPKSEPFEVRHQEDIAQLLKQMLGRLDICSKEYWVRQYDHEVQGGSVVKPLVGAGCDGPSDAAVVRPVLDLMKGVAVGHGICPRYSDFDSYHMAAVAVDEAMRNIVSVGADPDRTVALDNFCWCDPVFSKSNPDGKHKLAQLVRANKALYDICTIYGMPLVSGKDSMKNDYSIGTTKISIPPTLLVTAVGIVESAERAVTMDAKNPGDHLYLLGETFDDLGASQYADLSLCKGGTVPMLRDPKRVIARYRWLHKAIKTGLVASCHDLSDGGLGVALAETAFAGDLGLVVDLRKVRRHGITRDDFLLFSETPGRLLVTVPQEAVRAFETLLGDDAQKLGIVTADKQLQLTGLSGKTIADVPIATLKEAWQKPLRF
jgi:phosphoribosylformylglycinamidine synthase